MKYLVYLLFFALVIAHHDFWWWDQHRPFIFGTIPVGLAWHVGISLGAAFVGILGILFCWPVDDDEEEALIDAAATTPTPTQERS